MTIHEYGKSNAKTVVLVHPSVVMWDFFEYLIPLLEKDCHVIIPALPGYDENDSQQNFTSVENIAGELAEMPWLLTRFIAVKDFLLISMGKTGGFSLLEKVFATDEYSKEDLEYMAKVFRFISYKTIWRTFESCNNYRMPEGTIEYLGKLEYWYGDKERKERAKDLAYVKEHFLHVKFIEMKNMGHASMATLYPENMAERIMNLAK